MNNIIGDGVGRLSELLTTTNACHNTLLMNSASARENNELAFQKQSNCVFFVYTKYMHFVSDIELSTDQTLAQPISDNYGTATRQTEIRTFV